MPKMSTTVRPTVSVVIATYNRAGMVREAVLAAWNQTRRPDEIVVSDDCSSDNTLLALSELQREVPILKIVESLTNSGGVPNWNQVIEASSGDIIAWCSDDDRFKREHLENALNYLETNSAVDMVHAGFEEVLDGGKEGMHHQSIQLKSDNPIVIDRSNAIEYFSTNFSWPFHPSTFVFRRQLWNNVGLFNQKYALADTEWFLRAALNNKIAYLPYYGVINRRHSGDSGNWSARVGSVNMQRELYDSINAFFQAAQLDEKKIPELNRQFLKWIRRYRMLLARILVARSRAGAYLVAKNCAAEILRVTPVLLAIPGPFRTAVFNLFYLTLYWIQPILPGGRGKYRELGRFTPM